VSLISVAAGAGGACNGVLVVTGVGDGAEDDGMSASSMIATTETAMIAATQSLRRDIGGSHCASVHA
jgi:hypothetical protein